MIQFVGSTPVAWCSRRQNCIATSTYCAEFVAMRSAVEEAISLRYMLRCLGIPVPKHKPTNIYGDNWSVIQSASIPDSEMRKKHIAISYHYVREAIAAKTIGLTKTLVTYSLKPLVATFLIVMHMPLWHDKYERYGP